jgi:transposase
MEPKRPFTDLEWNLTPEPVRRYILYLEQIVAALQQQARDHEKRIEKLEVQSKQNSRNSSKPPSSDSPFDRASRKKKAKKGARPKGAQKGHKGHQRQMLEPTETHPLMPERCTCGHSDFQGCRMQPFYTHQQVELPEIEMEVSHWVLHRCRCPQCGKTVKAALPLEVRSGYGPRLCGFVAELSGVKAMSRQEVKKLCESVLGISIATGTIQKIIDRASESILPAYEKIGQMARRSQCNYVDETSWFMNNVMAWLWAMVNDSVAFYRIVPNRSKQAFFRLIEDWAGILVSDSYGLYRKWVHGRQVCLAHLIRKADALMERKKPDIRRFGQVMGSHLRQLIEFSKDPPTPLQWKTFYSHLLFTLSLWEGDDNDAGKLARQIVGEIESLWTFLDHEGVDPTNNRAERALRFGVLWRKRSLGTQSEKGNRWVERILSLKAERVNENETPFR